MRLIDADELVVDMRLDYNDFPSNPIYGTMRSTYGVTIQQIENAPTIDAVEALPSADRPQGRWIYDRYDSRGVNRCSECGAEIKGYGENIPFPNCPYCLARMKGAEDE